MIRAFNMKSILFFVFAFLLVGILTIYLVENNIIEFQSDLDNVIVTSELIEALKKKFNNKIAIVTGRGFNAISSSLKEILNQFNVENSVFKTESGTGRIKFRVGRDVRLLIIVVGALTNQIPILLIIVAVLANFEAIRRLILFRNKLGDDVTDTHIEFAN